MIGDCLKRNLSVMPYLAVGVVLTFHVNNALSFKFINTSRTIARGATL